jgi:hypothetical protein
MAMDVGYFLLCVLGGAFILLVPWSGIMLLMVRGQGTSQAERNAQARKQAAEHPAVAGQIARDTQQKPNA